MEEHTQDSYQTNQAPRQKQSFIKFDKMITPAIIQVIFIASLIFFVFTALILIIDGGASIFAGLLLLIFGPLIARVYCELLIVIFKIHESLEEIRLK